MTDCKIFNLLLCGGLMVVLKSACQLAKHTKRRDEQTDRQTVRQSDCFITVAMSFLTAILIMAKPKCCLYLKFILGYI